MNQTSLNVVESSYTQADKWELFTMKRVKVMFCSFPTAWAYSQGGTHTTILCYFEGNAHAPSEQDYVITNELSKRPVR